jgi:PAS domain S-box-containing protein
MKGRRSDTAGGSAEPAFSNSKKFLQTIIESEPECVKLVAPDGSLLMMNRAGLALIQADSFEEVKGKSIYPLIMPAYREDFKRTTEDVFQGKTRTLVFEITGLKGKSVWLNSHVVPLRDDNDNIVAALAITRDVTEQKRAEKELQEALQRAGEEKNKSAAIIAAIGDGISIQDRDFKIIYQNQFQKDLAGDHVGEYCYKAYERREAVCEGCPVAMSFLDGNVHTSERSVQTDRGVLHVEITSSPLRDSSGSIIAGIEVVRNITARKQMEVDRENLIKEQRDLIATVTRSHKEWKDTFDSIQDPIYITDNDFRIIKANKAFMEFAGKSFQKIIGRTCYELLHGSTEPHPDCPLRSMRHSGNPADIELVDPKTKKTLVVSHFPFITPEGLFGGTINLVRDVTQEREKEMRLIMSERLASLGQMAASIAHEINNPLTAILGCAEGLRNRVNQERYDPVLFKNYLKIIEEEVARCKNITTGMLSFVRKSSPEKKTVDIHEILDSALEIAGFQGRLRAVRVLKRYEPGRHAVHGNDGELKQVFLTMITNALDAMDDTGTLSIETGTESGAVFLAFRDTGSGIPSEYINRIFDPFFTTKTERGGTGLGLSIAKKILANHHGDVLVASDEDKGTTFTITLPLSS